MSITLYVSFHLLADKEAAAENAVVGVRVVELRRPFPVVVDVAALYAIALAS